MDAFYIEWDFKLAKNMFQHNHVLYEKHLDNTVVILNNVEKHYIKKRDDNLFDIEDLLIRTFD